MSDLTLDEAADNLYQAIQDFAEALAVTIGEVLEAIGRFVSAINLEDIRKALTEADRLEALNNVRIQWRIDQGIHQQQTRQAIHQGNVRNCYRRPRWQRARDKI